MKITKTRPMFALLCNPWLLTFFVQHIPVKNSVARYKIFSKSNFYLCHRILNNITSTRVHVLDSALLDRTMGLTELWG